MSRALCIAATRSEVVELCEKHGAPISAIEPLESGGTRVVLRTSDDAVTIAKAYRKKLIAGEVVRIPSRIRGPR